MARITVEDCLEKVENQYDLVLLAKERTSQLNSGAEMLVEKDNDKNTVVALREIGEGKVNVDDLKNGIIVSAMVSGLGTTLKYFFKKNILNM